MSQEHSQVHPAQWSREQMREAIQAEVEREQAEQWSKAKEKHGDRLKNLDAPPPPFALWQAEKEPERRGPRVEKLLDAVGRKQLGDAELLQDLVGDQYRYDYERDEFMQFDGVLWVPDKVRNIRKQVYQLAEHFERAAHDCWGQSKSLSREIAEIKARNKEANVHDQELEQKKAEANFKKLDTRAGELRSDTRITKILNLATVGDGSMGMVGTEWDQHPTLFPCANGIIDLATGRLLRGNPNLFMRKGSKYEYHGLHVPCPFWMDTLYKALCRDPELLEYFELVIGYSMTGLVAHKDFWVAYGPKADNAKSTIFDNIREIAGGYAGEIKTEVLLWRRNKQSGPNPDLMDLDGLRMAIASEPESGEKFDKEMLKVATGGGMITARGLYENNVRFRPMCKLFLHTNFLPQIKGADKAFFNRLRIIPFNAKFETNPHLVDESRHIYQAINRGEADRRIWAEGPGILSWLVRCAKKYLAKMELIPPSIVLSEVESYRGDMDPVAEWIDQWCIVNEKDEGLQEQAKNLYSSFKRYCQEETDIQDQYILSPRAFGDQLKQRFSKKKTNVVFYLGIKIQTGKEGNDDTHDGK